MKTIKCTECGKQITYKNELKISGKLLQPYHSACLANPKSTVGKFHKWYGSFPTGLKFWSWLIIGNAAPALLLTNIRDSATVLFVFVITFNIVFIIARIGIYLSYERFLK